MRTQLLQLIPARRPVPTKPRILEGAITDYGIRELIEYTVAPDGFAFGTIPKGHVTIEWVPFL